MTLSLFHIISEEYNRAALCSDARDALGPGITHGTFVFFGTAQEPQKLRTRKYILLSDDAHYLVSAAAEQSAKSCLLENR